MPHTHTHTHIYIQKYIACAGKLFTVDRAEFSIFLLMRTYSYKGFTIVPISSIFLFTVTPFKNKTVKVYYTKKQIWFIAFIELNAQLFHFNSVHMETSQSYFSYISKLNRFLAFSKPAWPDSFRVKDAIKGRKLWMRLTEFWIRKTLISGFQIIFYTV